jgi:hypothetical protein
MPREIEFVKEIFLGFEESLSTNPVFKLLFSNEIQREILPLKIIFLLFSAFLLSFIIYLLRKTSWLKFYLLFDLIEFSSYKPYERKTFEAKWSKIKKRLKKGWEAELKLAIIEADNLLDEVLKNMGYPGNTLGERLDQIDINVIDNLDEVWRAHRIRNNIVHDPDYYLSLNEAEEAIEIFEKTFKKLELLE